MLDVGTEIKEYLSSKKIIIADFWAEWCIPCKAVDDAIKRIIPFFKNSEDVVFLRINVDEHPDIAADFEVFNLPTVIVFFNGKEVERITTPHGLESKMFKIIKNLLKNL